jgi:hypothetical protein
MATGEIRFEEGGITKWSQLERMVERFNKNFPVGSKVMLRKGVGDEAVEVETSVTAPATILGFHSAVAWFEGVVGCYSIDGRVRKAD